MIKFNPTVCERMGHYVYCLIDPRDKYLFYIGKGVNNRVFAHVNDALETSDNSDKLDHIRDIHLDNLQVEHRIIKHGLSEEEAFLVESALIDFSEINGMELTNAVRGHHSDIVTIEEAVHRYSPELIDELKHDCVIININKAYRKGMSFEEIYTTAKEKWVIAESKRTSLEYALIEFKGRIVAVFQPYEWYSTIDDKNGRLKWGFNGNIITDGPVYEMYFNKGTDKEFGSQNPIRYKL